MFFWILVSYRWFCGWTGGDCSVAKVSEVQRISLTRNRRTVAYTETDGEKIQMAMKQWPEIVKAGIGHAKSIACVGDNADAGLLDRYVQSDRMVHAALLLLMLEARSHGDLVSPSA